MTLCNIADSPPLSSLSHQSVNVLTFRVLCLHNSSIMLGASLLPARWRMGDSSTPSSPPSYLSLRISPVLQSLTRRSCTHPINTIIFILLLASTSYVGLLETSLFDVASSNSASRPINLSTLVDGARQLKLGRETAWKWHADSRGVEEIDSVRVCPGMFIMVLIQGRLKNIML